MKNTPVYMRLPVAYFLATLFTIRVYGQAGNDSLPSYIPPSCAGQALTKMSREEMLAMTEPAIKFNPTLSKTDQVKLFDSLAKIISNVYLYPDFRGLAWKDTVTRYRANVLKAPDTEKFYALMEQFVSSLGDKHSNFESPVKTAEANAQLAGNNKFVGVGALFQALTETKQVTVLAVIPGSPAEYGGLQQHDVLLDVDGLPLVRNDKVYPYTRGTECSVATLRVQSPGQEPRKISLVRTRISGSFPVYARLVPTGDGRRIGYIFLPTFFDLTIPAQVQKALENFGTLDGLVLDNRMNGGGSSKVLFPILSYFTSGTVGQFISRSSRRALDISATPVGNSQEVPLVILVGKNTVSYAEVFSGILQDNGRATIVGQPTAGKVETLHGYSLPGGSMIWIAEERFDPARSHTDWQGRGVQPDKMVVSQWDQFTFENDPALAAALRLFRAKK